MTKKILLFIFILSIPSLLIAQITINTADLPHAGSNYGFVNEDPGVTIDYSTTGANHTWDFTSLGNTGTGIDSFLTLSQLPSDFQSYFVGADMADNQGGTIAGYTLQGAYSAYNNNALGFYNRGFGGTVPGLGVTLPFIYIPGDQAVKFSLNYNDSDHTTCYAVSGVPGFVSITRYRDRTNTVDGWGLLQLPSGDYQTLRLKADIMDHDSVYIDLIGSSQTFDVVTHEYNWYAIGKGIPVLQIITDDQGAVNSIRYQDPSLLPNIISETQNENSFFIYPNPASEKVFVQTQNNFSGRKLLITDATGKLLSTQTISASNATTLDVSALANGIYFVKVVSDTGILGVEKLVVIH